MVTVLFFHLLQEEVDLKRKRFITVEQNKILVKRLKKKSRGKKGRKQMAAIEKGKLNLKLTDIGWGEN